MAKYNIPLTMKAWQFSSTNGGLENNLKLNPSAPVPKPTPNQHLVQVLATSLNPVDFKPVEVPLLGRFLVSKPATPGLDIVGRIVKPAAGSAQEAGQLVLGASGTSIFAGGGLAEYAVVKPNSVAVVPKGIDFESAASVTTAGITAYLSIEPYVKEGSRVFINGGSGGTGVFGIQIAKAMGCHVTTSCSGANVELCKSLGADVVLDYKKRPLIASLKEQKPFDHVVDNPGYDYDLYWRCQDYTTPHAKYALVGSAPSLAFGSFMLKVNFLPKFLGGGKRKLVPVFASIDSEKLEKLSQLMVDGKVKAVIDETFDFERGADAMRKLKTGRAKGKIVVHVASGKE